MRNLGSVTNWRASSHVLRFNGGDGLSDGALGGYGDADSREDLLEGLSGGPDGDRTASQRAVADHDPHSVTLLEFESLLGVLLGMKTPPSCLF